MTTPRFSFPFSRSLALDRFSFPFQWRSPLFPSFPPVSHSPVLLLSFTSRSASLGSFPSTDLDSLFSLFTHFAVHFGFHWTMPYISHYIDYAAGYETPVSFNGDYDVQSIGYPMSGVSVIRCPEYLWTRWAEMNAERFHRITLTMISIPRCKEIRDPVFYDGQHTCHFALPFYELDHELSLPTN